MTFTVDRSPHFHWGWINGSNHAGNNVGAIDGALLTANGLTTALASIESQCDACGCNVVIFNSPCGFLVNAATPAATWGVLSNYYPHVITWLQTTFQALKRPGRRYGLYIGGRAASVSPSLTEYIDDEQILSIPAGSFFVDAVAPFRALGFSIVWTDATEGDPSLRPAGPNANDALRAAGWQVGAEFVPHTGIIYPVNQLDVETSILADRAHLITWREWRDKFRSRFAASVFPSTSEVHICPQYQDTDFTTAVVDELLAQNAIISPYSGFADLTSPSVAAYIKTRQSSRRRTPPHVLMGGD